MDGSDLRMAEIVSSVTGPTTCRTSIEEVTGRTFELPIFDPGIVGRLTGCETRERKTLLAAGLRTNIDQGQGAGRIGAAETHIAMGQPIRLISIKALR
jgi:hypothetical protein